MVFSYKELKNKYKSNYQIKKLIKKGLIYKVDDGIYSDKFNCHYLEIVLKKYPNAVVSGNSAFYYHNLTKVIPSRVYITTNRNSGRYNDSNIKQSYTYDKYLSLGKTYIDYEGVKVAIYDKERMLLELVKNKSIIAYDYYKEIIHNYRKIIDKLDICKLQEYASVYPNGDRLMAMIQNEVF